jgi:hypothetical protein
LDRAAPLVQQTIAEQLGLTAFLLESPHQVAAVAVAVLD